MFNKSEIMRRAWAIVKAGPNWQKYRLIRLRYALQDAWCEAKRAAKAVPQAAADRLRAAIWVLECKDRLCGNDWQILDALRSDLRAAEYAAAA